jgi:hypothetical protein
VGWVKANLTDDEANETIVSLEVESDEDYHPGGWFQTDDGGIYLIAEVRAGAPPIDVELDAILIEGPHPTTLVGRHS